MTVWLAGSALDSKRRSVRVDLQANVFRDPRWGRGQETAGEDPYLVSEYAFLFVSGFQGGVRPTYLKASSCCKHFAAYSEEAGRMGFNAVVYNKQDFTDTYFPAFQSCAQRAGASGVMCR